MTPQPTKPCVACGAAVHKRPKESRSQWAEHRFCSRVCARRARSRRDLSTRLWSRVTITSGDGCWLWNGATTPGGKYGVIWTGTANIMILTHVAAHLEHIGPIPEGWQVDHLCRVTLCCNPRHLEAVTQSENLRRQAAAVTHCIRGHEYTPANTYHPPAKPTWRQCRICIKIRTDLATQRRREAVAQSA